MNPSGETKKQNRIFTSLVFSVLLISLTSTSPLAAAVQEDQDASAPLERAPASQSQIQNNLGKELDYVLVDQQILIVADVVNALDRQQAFAYIVQIQDETGTVISLGWLSGSLFPNQFLSPALSWTPQYPGMYHATIFVWEAIDNPSALSHTLELEIDVKLTEA